ncbi:MAG: ATP-binding cassette domain-containing protein [Atopobiaceae bacterium]|nr:ATP-binding cassette domain-containing protein [Atopobiaceae bacterium]
MTMRIPTRRWERRDEDGDLALVGLFPTSPARVWSLDKPLVVGRLGSDADVEIPSGFVSREHGQVGVVAGRVLYRDLNSTNGTWLAGERLTDTVELREGDALCFASAATPDDVVFRLVLAPVRAEGLSWRKVPFGGNVQQVVFGRGLGDVDVADSYVSGRHASVYHSSKGPYIIDLGSTNGVVLNGYPVKGAVPLSAGDIIRIGQTLVYVTDDVLWVGEGVPDAPEGVPDVPEDAPDASIRRSSATSTNGLAIDIKEKNVWTRLKSKTILKDVHLTVSPGEFVLILGGSGAGKTTFLKAVMGESKAEGTIRLGDLDVYEEYERIKYQIGYVPQQDLVRHNDTVYETLFAAARLRLPSHCSDDECEERVAWATELLGLSRESDTMVGRLSGGQRKRLSIAVELVGDPKLFFLDEPDSGLDGVMARALMQNLRSIADLGKMVLVITHGPDRAADLFHKVIVLAKSDRDGSGHLLFCGSVNEAKTFFGVDTLEGIVGRINRSDEGGEGRADYYLDKWEGR